MPITTTFYPTIDSSIDGLHADDNYGASDYLPLWASYVGVDKDSFFRIILNFDISSIAASTIHSVELALYVDTVMANPGDGTLFRVVRYSTWTEDGITWNDFNGVDPWSTAGCDHDGDDYDGTTPTPITFTTPGSTGFWTITGLLAFATKAIATEGNIVSLKLELDDEAPGVNTGVRCSSREVPAAFRPRLVVSHTPAVGEEFIQQGVL